MMDMKYVVVDSDEKGQQIFICPREVDHDRFAEVLSNIRFGYDRNWERHYAEPIAAGFTDGVKCWGHSETLNLKSRGEVDAALLTRSLPPEERVTPVEPAANRRDAEPTPWRTAPRTDGSKPRTVKLSVEERLREKAAQRNLRKN